MTPAPFWEGQDMSIKVDPAHAATLLGNVMSILSDQMGQTPPATQDPATAAAPTPDQAAQTANPLEGTPAVSQGYGVQNDHESGHPGVDFAVPVGSPVLAATSGTVTVASGGQGGYGNLVEIQAADGTITRYGHLSQIGIAAGTTVKAGQRIGVSGGQAGAEGAGNSTGPHLHFEVHTPTGQLEDPIAFLASARPIVGEAPTQPATPASASGIVDITKSTAQDPTATKGPVPAATTPAATPDAAATNAEVNPGDFFGSLLAGIGAPDTPENRRALSAWQRAEGGSVDNPFNTTQGAPGATNFNSVGVKRYPSVAVGIQATLQTLLNGRYANIISALKNGGNAMSVADAIENSPWGTGGLVKKVLGG